MSDGTPSTPNEDAPLEAWRQGDFASDAGGFLFAKPPAGGYPYDAKELTEGIVGLVIISQTCDIIRRTGGRHYVAVCPLITVDEADVADIKKGRRPYLTDVENAGETVFADLRRIMSVHKDLLRAWVRHEGFSSEEGRVRFAAALERKFGQFAFPDDFDKAIQAFRKRVWRRHDKSASPIGEVYRSLLQIRFHADPDWQAAERVITVIAILQPKPQREAAREDIRKELDTAPGQIAWPDGYKWASPKYMLAAAADLSGADIIASRRGDFDYLCY